MRLKITRRSEVSTDEKQSKSYSGISFGSLLTLLFIGLKLTGYITWSWWWVLSPLWIGVAIILICLLLVVIINMVRGK